MNQTRPPDPRRAWWVTLLLVALAAVTILGIGPLPQATIPVWAAIPALALAFAAVERWPLPVRRGDDAQFYSLAELPLTMGLLLVHPAALVAGRIIGQVVALYLRRRQSAEKLAFNVAIGVVEVLAAYATLTLVTGGTGLLEWRGALALWCAAVVVDLVSNLGLAAVLSAVEGRSRLDTVVPGVAIGLAPAIASASLSYLTVRLIVEDLWLVLPLGAVLTLVVLAFRAHTTLEAQNLGLERVSGFTSTIGVEQATISHVKDLLEEARTVLNAELVELTVDGPAGWYHLAGSLPTDRADASSVLELLPEPVAKATVIPAARATGRESRLQRATGLRDAMVVPLPPGGSVRGWLVVGDRPSGLSTFTAADLVVAEAVAGHLAVAYANAHLAEELRVQARESEQRARHDLLTGLPNRSALMEHCRLLSDDTAFSLLLVDLDRFKEVNDTLGHAAGDDLLVQVAQRMRHRLGTGPFITRLGGDEFALVVAGTALEGMAVGERLLAALGTPFRVTDVEVQIGASVGVSHHPTHGTAVGDLLQHADVAMYKAKHTRGGIQLYALADDNTSDRQLQLSTDLSTAIGQGTISVDHIPVVTLLTRHVQRLDAVARWVHPRHGPVPQEEFMALAERSGLVRDLTVHIARAAVTACAQRQAEGSEAGVGVEVSARIIVDRTLPNTLIGILAHAGVPPQSLTVQITEPDLMADPERAGPVLTELAAAGVRLVVTAFGTGYSSLPELARLGLDGLRIDATLTATHGRAQGSAVLRSMIGLGHNLGLVVEADGVEDPSTLNWLLSHGCDVGRGRALDPAVMREDLIEEPIVPPVLRR